MPTPVFNLDPNNPDQSRIIQLMGRLQQANLSGDQSFNRPQAIQDISNIAQNNLGLGNNFSLNYSGSATTQTGGIPPGYVLYDPTRNTQAQSNPFPKSETFQFPAISGTPAPARPQSPDISELLRRMMAFRQQPTQQPTQPTQLPQSGGAYSPFQRQSSSNLPALTNPGDYGVPFWNSWRL